jgi:hypothetical protein
MRDGDWGDDQYIWARLVNELMFFRADHAAIHARKKMRPSPLLSPAQEAEKQAKRADYLEVRAHIMSQIGGTPTDPGGGDS